MKLSVNDIVKFDNGSYLVLDIINNKSSLYVFLINNDRFINDISIVKVTQKDNCLDFAFIDDDKEFEYILCKLYLNNKRNVLSLFD